jgi:N-acetylneuraminic acid mutarotase
VKYTRILPLFLIAILTLAAHSASAQTAPTLQSNHNSTQPSTGPWVDRANIPVAVQSAASASDDTYYYAIGGYTYDNPANPTALSIVQRFDPANNSWSMAASAPVSITNASACYMNRKIYVAGGFLNASTRSNTIRIYNLMTNIWSNSAAYAADTFVNPSIVCVPHNDLIYVIGGFDSTSIETARVRIYNPATNAWLTDGAPMPAARGWGNAGLLAGGRIIYAGGEAANTERAEAYIYNIATNIWLTDYPLPTAVANGASAVGPDGKFYVTGGESICCLLSDTYIYDPVANSWSTSPGQHDNVGFVSGAFVGANFIVAGGYGGGNCTPYETCHTTRQLDTDCANAFNDIQNNVFYNAIHNLSCRGIVNGTGATTFGPSVTSTRAQFAKVVVLGFAIPLANPAQPSFSDVPTNYFAYQFIEGGKAAGILSGLDAATCAANGQPTPCYLPNKPITRAQLTKLVISAAGYTLVNPPNPTFSDVPSNSVFYQFIETAAAKSVVNGTGGGLFQPNLNISRDQMCQIVYKALITP